ncbi:MAG: PAS domain-containing protein, partial [Coleofasciculus sp. S288]|nr:PAS domain-containing protein [Coleofasciculus sp. S288]
MNDQVKAVLWEDIFAGDGEMEALMRRLKALRDLALQTSGAKTELEACRIAADILSAHPGDVSFALLYLLDRTQTEQAQLLETVGCEPGTLASPLRVDTASPGIWPFDTVLKTGQAVVATDLSHRMSCPSPVSWSEPPHTALVLPITPSGQSQPAGFLVAGISSQLVLDDEYRTFLELVAGQIATAVAKARAEEERTQADALAELDRAKTAFFSPVSHEFLTPITLDPKLAEDALADTEQPLSPQQRERINEAARAQVIDVLESITDGFFSLDSRWRLTYVNQATERLSGKTRGELLGRSIWEVYPGLIGSTFDEQIRRAVREQVAVHFETPSVHAGIWREVHAYPHQNGLSIYWRDITNRKQAEEALRRREEELRLLADAVPALISYVDRDRCFRFVNRAYTDWFGHPAEEIIGQTVEEFVGETAYQHMRPHVEAALAGESVTVEMWIPFQAGGPRYVRRQYIPDLNERGEVKGFYALINDLTTL